MESAAVGCNALVVSEARLGPREARCLICPNVRIYELSGSSCVTEIPIEVSGRRPREIRLRNVRSRTSASARLSRFVFITSTQLCYTNADPPSS